jgi:Methylase involved in ubiquinone/menaquinone biosynthesis
VKTGTFSTFQKDYFDAFYTDYARQNPRHKLDFYKELVDDAKGSIAQSRPRLLDIGCAFGFFLSCIDTTWQRYGIDISAYAIDQARRRVPEAHLMVSNATMLPFKEKFDMIVAFDILEHVPRLETASASILSKLAPGGYFIFVVPVYDGPTGPIIRLLDRDTTHVQKKSRNFWLRWTSTYFDLCQWQGVFRYLFPFGTYIHVPTKLLRRLTPAIAVVARKKCA